MTDTKADCTIMRLRQLIDLSDPLFGHYTHRTFWSLIVFAVLLALIIGNRLSRILTVGGEPLETMTHVNPVTTYLVFSSVTAAIIGLVTVGILIGPFVYAVWNGGPVVAFMIPVVLIALPDILLGRYVFDLDWAIAVTVGASGAALAMYVDDVRRKRSLRPWTTQSAVLHRDIRLQFVTVFFVGTLISVARFVSTSPEYIVAWYSPFAILLSLPAVIVLGYWVLTVRSIVADNRGPIQADESPYSVDQGSMSNVMGERTEPESLPKTEEH